MEFRVPTSPELAIEEYAERYCQNATESDREKEAKIMKIIAPEARQVGFLTKPDIEIIRQWKWPAAKGKLSRDCPPFIEAVTRTALATPNEQLRIEILTLLDGVSWSMASAILHLVHPEPYPILDVRALRTLGVIDPIYDFGFWRAYTAFCRDLADTRGVTMRVLDRALWRYDKEHYGEGT